MIDILKCLDKIEVIDCGEDRLSRVRIKDGIGSGMVIQYGKVQINESEDKSKCTLRFEYEIIENPENQEETPELTNKLGDIIVAYLEGYLNESSK